LREKTDKLYRT